FWRYRVPRPCAVDRRIGSGSLPDWGRSFTHRARAWLLRRFRSISEDDTGFELGRVSLADIRLEAPLEKGIGNAFCLIRKRAKKMDVLYLAVFIDDDPHGDRVESALGKDRIDFLRYVLGACVVLNANRNIIAASPQNRTGFRRQLYFVH